MKRKVLLILIIAVLVLPAAFGDGGGGVMFGQQVSRYSFLDDIVKQQNIAGNTLGLVYTGGFGYGVSWNNAISGGFGYFLSDPEKTGTGGAFGGSISGYRFLRLPINLSFVAYTGFGAVWTGENTVNPEQVYFALSEELVLEAGIPLFRWFMPVVYAGYQVIGNIGPQDFFGSFFSYTPVVGMRVSWGNFY